MKNKKNPKVVAFGGGTGLYSLLSGLKHTFDDIEVIVTVADDGGSSGRLKRELKIPPPGDIRNCIVALSESEPLMKELMQYRFDNGSLKGHSFGNIFLAAMTKLTGSFPEAVEKVSTILKVKGRIHPSTLELVSLKALTKSGKKIRGESKIGKTTDLLSVELHPRNPEANPLAIKAVESADVMIFGPGSLYTSILPNLLVKGMVEAIKKNERALKIFVLNVMTQPGETQGYTASDHVKAIFRHTEEKIFDVILVNTGVFPGRILKKYAKEGAYPVAIDRGELEKLGLKIVSRDLALGEDFARHDPEKLARAIYNIYHESIWGKAISKRNPQLQTG